MFSILFACNRFIAIERIQASIFSGVVLIGVYLLYFKSKQILNKKFK